METRIINYRQALDLIGFSTGFRILVFTLDSKKRVLPERYRTTRDIELTLVIVTSVLSGKERSCLSRSKIYNVNVSLRIILLSNLAPFIIPNAWCKNGMVLRVNWSVAMRGQQSDSWNFDLAWISISRGVLLPRRQSKRGGRMRRTRYYALKRGCYFGVISSTLRPRWWEATSG